MSFAWSKQTCLSQSTTPSCHLPPRCFDHSEVMLNGLPLDACITVGWGGRGLTAGALWILVHCPSMVSKECASNCPLCSPPSPCTPHCARLQRDGAEKGTGGCRARAGSASLRPVAEALGLLTCHAAPKCLFVEYITLHASCTIAPSSSTCVHFPWAMPSNLWVCTPSCPACVPGQVGSRRLMPCPCAPPLR